MIEKKILLLSLSDEKNWNFDKNIYIPITKLFSEVIRFEDYRKRCKLVGTKKLQHEIIKMAKVHRPDYVLWPASMYEILEETFVTLQNLGCKTIGWFFDDEVRFLNYSKWWLPYFDFVMTGSKEAVPQYKRNAVNAIYVPIACNPESYYFVKDSVSYEVSFVGRLIGNRKSLLRSIEEGGIEVAKFGLDARAEVSFERLIKIFSNSRINLNFTGSYSNCDNKQLKARIFEVPMCGGFLLTEYVQGIEEFFEIDKEVVCFVTVNEAIEKINYYLKHENERKAIAQAGWKRVLKDHTWEKRLGLIFEKINSDMEDHIIKVRQHRTKMPNKLRQTRSRYHYNLAKEWLNKQRNDIAIDELIISMKFGENLKSRFLIYMCRMPEKLSIKLFQVYKLISSVYKKCSI